MQAPLVPFVPRFIRSADPRPSCRPWLSCLTPRPAAVPGEEALPGAPAPIPDGLEMRQAIAHASPWQLLSRDMAEPALASRYSCASSPNSVKAAGHGAQHRLRWGQIVSSAPWLRNRRRGAPAAPWRKARCQRSSRPIAGRRSSAHRSVAASTSPAPRGMLSQNGAAHVEASGPGPRTGASPVIVKAGDLIDLRG